MNSSGAGTKDEEPLMNYFDIAQFAQRVIQFRDGRVRRDEPMTTRSIATKS
jgi:hypothetical protein